MRKYFLIMFFGLLSSACDRFIDSLPGVYVNHSAGTFSVAFDTLVISKQGDDGNTFSIDRRVSFQKIRHGVLQSKEYHLEQWFAVYNDKTKTLTETKKGKIISYVPEKKKLYVNNSVYQKIN